jgi:DNA-3-methyladenine glycosylase II
MKPVALNQETLLKAARHLARRDAELGAIFETHGPPPLWARRPGFDTLLQIILEQQVSLSSARSIGNRLRQNIKPFSAARIIEIGEDYLRSLGLTRQKAHYCVQLANAFADGRLKRLGSLNDDDVHSQLVSIKGIGSWSANVYLLMALRRPDIWPDGDIALAIAMTKIRGMDQRISFRDLSGIAESWRPYRSVAARMLWHFYLEEKRLKKEAAGASHPS